MEVEKFVVAYFEKSGQVPGSTLADKLKVSYIDAHLVDSMQVVQMINHFEEHFGIAFSFEDMQDPSFTTIGGITSIIKRNLPSA